MLKPGSSSLVLLRPPALGEVGELPGVSRRFWHCPIAAPQFRDAAIRILSAHQRRHGRPDTAKADLESLARSRGRAMAWRWHHLIGTPDWLPPYLLQQNFAAATRIALAHSATAATPRDWSDAMLQSPLELVAARAAESSWHWSRVRASWETVRRCTAFLSRLQFLDRDGLCEPRLTVRVEATRTSIGCKGRSRFTRSLFLDANLALLLDWDGEHAATISFAWTAEEGSDEPILRVRQIQFSHPKGNRWAFRFGDCYFTAFLAALARAASGIARVQVVKGESLAKSYVEDYRNQAEHLRSFQSRWDAQDRLDFAALQEKAAHYAAEVGPRLARVYAQVPKGWKAKGRAGGYRELVAA